MRKLGRITGVLLLSGTLLLGQTSTGVKSGTATAPEGEIKSGVQKPVSEDLVNPETAIRARLEAQVGAWNRGDLKGYMQGYRHSPELTFFAGSKESAGWEAAYQRYRSAYLGKNQQMGKLNFSEIRVDVLSPEAAFVRGRWQLTMRDGSKRSGLFTVVLKRFSDGWQIIHDHSS